MMNKLRVVGQTQLPSYGPPSPLPPTFLPPGGSCPPPNTPGQWGSSV